MLFTQLRDSAGHSERVVRAERFPVYGIVEVRESGTYARSECSRPVTVRFGLFRENQTDAQGVESANADRVACIGDDLFCPLQFRPTQCEGGDFYARNQIP